MREGVLLVQDGPFADTKEQLGGTIVIDVPDLDAAISWAREAPPVRWGAVEIRPGATHTVDLSQLSDLTRRSLRTGETITLFGVPRDDRRLVANGYVQLDDAPPAASPRSLRCWSACR